MNMSDADFWASTLHAFHRRLTGWREAKEADRLEAWRQTRTLAGYTLAIGQWKKGKEPNIIALMPLPGDPTPESNLIEISDEEMALRKYKLKRRGNGKVRFDEEFETLIRKHYKPEWGNHPDEYDPKPKPV